MVVDMTGMGSKQIIQVNKYLLSLPKSSQSRLIKIGF